MFRVAIVEDEQVCADKMREYLLRFEREQNEKLQITCYKDGIVFLDDNVGVYDIVFMDIDMPHFNGLRTAKSFRKLNSCGVLIFTTNLAQYAINGYEMNAMDYMLKPVTYEALLQRLKRAIRIAGKKKSRTVLLKVKSGYMQMELSDIYYIEVMKHRLFYHTDSGIIEVWDALSKVEADMADAGFARCNSCYLVNLKYVTALQEEYVWVNEEKLKVSRGRKKEFASALMDYMQGLKLE